MSSYRLFCFGNDQHIVRARVVDCSDDPEAIAVARALCGDYRAVEVWQLARYVQRLDWEIDAGEAVA